MQDHYVGDVGNFVKVALNAPKVPVSRHEAWRTFWFERGLEIQRKALILLSKGCFYDVHISECQTRRTAT